MINSPAFPLSADFFPLLHHLIPLLRAAAEFALLCSQINNLYAGVGRNQTSFRDIPL
jgi:hypothetical protein